MKNEGLLYIPGHQRLFLMLLIILANIFNLSVLIDIYTKNDVFDIILYTVFTLFFTAFSLETFLFLLQVSPAKKITQEEKMKIYQEGFEQGKNGKLNGQRVGLDGTIK